MICNSCFYLLASSQTIISHFLCVLEESLCFMYFCLFIYFSLLLRSFTIFLNNVFNFLWPWSTFFSCSTLLKVIACDISFPNLRIIIALIWSFFLFINTASRSICNVYDRKQVHICNIKWKSARKKEQHNR